MLKKLLCIVLSLVLVLSGVYIGSPGSYAADEGTDRDLKVLKVAWRGDPTTLCHVTSTVSSFNTVFHELMMDRLFEYDYASGQVLPMLATGWEQLSDKTIRITLRSDVYSWNGDRFKASDVLYTIQSAIDSGKLSRYYGNFDTDNFVVEDDTHIVIALNKANPFIQYDLSNIHYGMLCQASVTAAGGLENISGPEADLPNCYTGPYKPVEWEEGSHIKFVKNANYWGEEPYYDEIIVYSILDASARAQAVKDGTVDLALMPAESFASDIENNSSLDVYTFPTNQQITLFMNTQRAPFDDVNFRISCALALNYENNIQVILGGFADHSDDILAKKNIQYTSPSAEGYDSYFHYDPEETAEYMPDSPYYGTNPTVEIYYTSQFASYAALVQQQWSAIGINVVLTELSTGDYYSVTASGDYQAYIVNNSNPDPYEQLKFYDGGHFNYAALLGGPQWNGGEEVTALFDSITSAYSVQAAAPYYKQLRRAINDNVPSVPLYSPCVLMYGKKGLTGLGLTLMGDPYFAKVRGTEQSAPAAYLSYGTDQYTRNDDDVVYDFVLGDYKQLVNEAINKTDQDERYAAYAKAEAELLDSGVIIPTSTNGGKVASFFGMLNLNRGTFALGNGNAASNKTESEKISAAVAFSNRNFRKALQFAFDKASYFAVNYGEEHKYDNLRNILTTPNLVSLSKQIEADGHVFDAGTTYGQMVQYYLTALGSHINAEDGQDGWYDPAAAVQALNAAKSELGSAVSYPIVIDLVYNNQSSNGTDQAQAYKQSIEQTLGSENVRVDLISANQDDFYDCAYWVDYGSGVNTDLNLSAGWAADNNDPYDFLSCFMKDGAFIINLGLSTAPASATGIYGVRPLDGNNEFFIELGDSVTLSVDSSSMYSNPRQVKWFRLDAESDTLIADCGMMTTGLQTLEVQPDTFTTYYCEVEDTLGASRDIYFFVYINNGLTIAPKDNEYVKYFEIGKDVIVEVEASADRGEISYIWYEIGDEDPILLSVTEEPYYLFKNVSAEKTVSCTASDDYGNKETVNMGLVPVEVEVNTSENVLSVGTGSGDNNVAGSAVPDEVLSAAVENGQAVTVNIVVSTEAASDIPEAEITAIEDKIAEAFPDDSSESISYVTIDLNYTVGEEDPAPITETSEALQITIAVPNAEEGKQYIVVRMHDGRAEVVPSVYEYDTETHTGTITITSDKFSTYAIRQVESFYTVEFDTLGGTSMPARILGTGSYIAPLPVPQKTGYVFNGWECAGEAFSIDTTVSSALDPDNDGTIVLTAKWIPAQYEVTFETNGGSAVEQQLVEYLGKAERPQDPVQEGFIFAGWTDAEGNLFSFNTLIKGNITLYAQWDVDPASAVETYPIWFNLYPDGIYAADDPETGETVFYDQETGEKVETRIQVTSNNLNDVLGDGGSIQYDPDSSILHFSDPDFGTSSYYGYNGEYSALVVGDTYVALVGSARIPTVYSSYPDSTIAFNGDFRMSSQYGALYTAGIVVVQGGSLYAGCNSIPIEADWLVIYGGEVTADAPMAIAVRTHYCIRVEGGSLIASSAPNEPAIYTDGYIAVSAGLDDTAGSINASVFTFPGEDPSSYESYEDLEYRMIALEGISLDGVGVVEPAQGKVSEIEYHTYDIYGDLQPCDAYAVTKADGSASAVVRVEVIPESFTVEFDSNGGSDVPAQTVIKGDCAVRPEDPVRGGYIFRGWKLNDGYYDFSSPVTGDICLVADWEEITVTLKAANLTLEGKISINFKLMSEYEGVTVRLYYEKNDYAQVAEVPLDINNFVVDGSDYYFLVSYNNIPAKEMTLKLRIKAFDSTGTQIPMKISSGYINEYDYSVASWCNRKIEQNSNANDVMIAKALLNYGHYSQLALKYNDGVNGRPNKLANPNGYLAAEMANFAGGNSAYDSITTGGTALGAKAFALVLESDTSIKLKLSRLVNAAVDGVSVTPAQENDNGTTIWAVYKNGIPAKKLHEKSSFKLTEGSNSATIYYGALSWANKKLTGSDVNDKNLAKAMYLYNYAARKYFHYDEAGLQ